MAIDPLNEHLISLTEAARMFPRNAAGKPPHLSRIYSYTTAGLRGVVLDSIQCGSRRCTSREAVGRFFAELTRAVRGDSAAPTRLDAERDNRTDVDAELDRVGL